MFDWLRLAAVLSRSQKLHALPDRRCRVEKDVMAGCGFRLDRFVPARPVGASLILLHGWTLRGKDDLRLQAFARALASAGVECRVPHLPGLAGLIFDRNDIVGLRAMLEEGPSPPGLVGFSFGGSYAVLAASHAVRQPRFVVSVSGYGDLPSAYRHVIDWSRQVPEHPACCENWLYCRLAHAWRVRDAFALAAGPREELRRLLESFCEGPDGEAVWRFCCEALGGVDWPTEDEHRQDVATLAALSVAEHPPHLACPVIILHDKNDDIMPASEASVLADAVRRGSPNAPVDMMVTTLLSHVTPGSLAFRPAEILRLLRLLTPLVRA
jgi:pimeloyl-ACP methyl ester carboxylesterase